MTVTDKIAYAVASGEYSDYRVHLVCLDKATAEAVCARMTSLKGNPDYSVEELPLVASPDEIVLRREYVVSLRRDGSKHPRLVAAEEPVVAPLADDPPVRVNLHGGVTAESYRGFEVAEKVARDKLAELKAREAGL